MAFNLSLVGWFGFASIWWVRDSQLGQTPLRDPAQRCPRRAQRPPPGAPPDDSKDWLLEASSSEDESSESDSSDEWQGAM